MDKKRKILKNSHGYTLVELITVLAIMAILGTMLVSLLNLGVRFYRTEDKTMENQNNARLAMAYITVKIRQNDVANGISVVSELDSLNNAVQVLKIKDASLPGNVFWIYYDHNTKKLREQSGNTGFKPVLEDGIEITEISYFNIAKSGAILHFDVRSLDSKVKLSQDITLRSP